MYVNEIKAYTKLKPYNLLQTQDPGTIKGIGQKFGCSNYVSFRYISLTHPHFFIPHKITIGGLCSPRIS